LLNKLTQPLKSKLSIKQQNCFIFFEQFKLIGPVLCKIARIIIENGTATAEIAALNH